MYELDLAKEIDFERSRMNSSNRKTVDYYAQRETPTVHADAKKKAKK